MAKKRKKAKHNPRRRARKHSFVSNPARRTRRRRAHHNPHCGPHRNCRHTFRSRRHSYRRNPESSIELALTLGAGAASAIIGNKLVSKLPGSAMVKNIGLVVLGALAAYIGRRKPLVMGVGSGLFITGATRLLTNAVPALAGDMDLTGDEQEGYVRGVQAHLAGEMNELSGPLSGPFNGPLSGPFNGPFSGPLAGPMI